MRMLVVCWLCFGGDLDEKGGKFEQKGRKSGKRRGVGGEREQSMDTRAVVRVLQ